MVEIVLLYFCLHVFHIDQKRVLVSLRGPLSQVIVVYHLIASISEVWVVMMPLFVTVTVSLHVSQQCEKQC